MPTLEVIDYQPVWPQRFAELQERIWPAVADNALGIEHVGSTAVPGLAAKPIIDIDVIVADAAALQAALMGLERLGYRHRGSLGIEGREALTSPRGWPAHHLYVCTAGCPALANHRAVRERLRRDPAAAARYGLLKKQLAARHPDDIYRYTAGKTDFLLELLAQASFPPELLQQIRAANVRPAAASPLSLRPATLEDLDLLRRWDAQPHVVAAAADGAWGGGEELSHPAPHCQKFIACVEDRPLGFLQILDPAQESAEDREYWGQHIDQSKHAAGSLRAIDLWIGEADALGQGYGTAMLHAALERCFADGEVVAVLADPLASNTRACRLYERLGFELIERRRFGEDDCCVYRLQRPGT